jgi:hypothetical protein
MSSSTRRTCSALLLLCIGLIGCPGPAAEVSINLVRGQGATLEGVTALRFIVRDLNAEVPEVFGPVEIDREQPMRLSATVTPGSPFYVDIWGCETVNRCVPQAVLARGCTPVLNVAGDTTLDLPMFDVGDSALDECPPTQE